MKPTPIRMDAYYYGFTPTGVEAIDRILSAVAWAGKAFHHTEDWHENVERHEAHLTGSTPVEWIQNAANEAAALSVPAAAVVGEPEPLTFPREMTDDLRDVLSKMMWNTGPIAHVLRAGGADIKTRAEDEQAHVLHWLICLVLEHGSEWRVKASERITEIRAALGGANHE